MIDRCSILDSIQLKNMHWNRMFVLYDYKLNKLLVVLRTSNLYSHLLLLLFVSYNLNGQENPKIIESLEYASSEERIRSLCKFFDYNVLHVARRPEDFNNFLSECYSIAKKDNDVEFRKYIDFYKNVNAIMHFSKDDLYTRNIELLQIFEEILNHCKLKNQTHFIPICHAYIGHVHFMQQDYAKSIEHLLIADEGFRKIGYYRFPEMSKHLHNMALVFYFFRHYNKVAELMEVSIKIPPYTVNFDIQRFNTLGAAYEHMKQYDKARKAFIQTRETAASYDNPIWIAIASRALARLSVSEGNYNEALIIYKNTLSISKEQNQLGYAREHSELLLGLAKTHILIHNPTQAQKYLNQINYKKSSVSLEQLNTFGSNYQEINYLLEFYDVQHRYNYAVKNYKNAYQYADSLYFIKYKLDSLFNGLEIQVAQNRIEAQDKQYENDKKEATINNKNRQVHLIYGLLAVISIATLLIVRKNRQINSKNKVINSQLSELSKMLKQKQVLLSELQHRIKNNLQHVISILEIQKESVDFNTIDELIRGNQNRIHSMALLHNKLNVADNVNDVDLKRYISDLTELVKDSYDNHRKKITLNVQCNVKNISIEKALPLGLIIVELLSNSMKHAFIKKSAGGINIELTQNQNGKLLYYTDNGEGYDFNKASKKGLGLEIIKGLIGQLGGEVETGYAGGFELKVYFN